MANISAFPASLQPIITQGFLEREFQQTLTSRLGFRAVAERRTYSPTHIGATVGDDRASPAGTEQFSITLNHYAASTDLNMVTSRVGIASQFLLNAAINGEQAARSLDELARQALMRAYLKPETTIRPNRAAAMADLRTGHILNMGVLLSAVAKLREAGIREIDGVYNCYLDPISARQLFSDHDFRQLFTGATSANQVFRQGMVNDFLGLRFIPTMEHHVAAHPDIPGAIIRRSVVAGAGALVEGAHANMAGPDIAPQDALVSIVDGVAMVTREPIARLQQIIAQSWYWIGGYAAPHLIVDGAEVYRHAVVVEHVG